MRVATLPRMGSWERDPAWASMYHWTVEHPRLGGALWRFGLGSDLGELHRATAEVERQPAGATVLDIPCGGGVALRGLRPGQGLSYVAADIAPAMLDRTMRAARTRGVTDQVVPVVADVHTLEFGDAAFDLVLSFTGLHCFPRPRDALGELGRVTRSGGTLSGSTLIRRLSPRMIPITAVGRLCGLLGPGLTKDELELWLADAGFTEVTVKDSGPMSYFRGTRR